MCTWQWSIQAEVVMVTCISATTGGVGTNRKSPCLRYNRCLADDMQKSGVCQREKCVVMSDSSVANVSLPQEHHFTLKQSTQLNCSGMPRSTLVFRLRRPCYVAQDQRWSMFLNSIPTVNVPTDICPSRSTLNLFIVHRTQTTSRPTIRIPLLIHGVSRTTPLPQHSPNIKTLRLLILHLLPRRRLLSLLPVQITRHILLFTRRTRLRPLHRIRDLVLGVGAKCLGLEFVVSPDVFVAETFGFFARWCAVESLG